MAPLLTQQRHLPQQFLTIPHIRRHSFLPGNTVSKGTTSKGFSIQEIDGATYIDGHLIANKTYALPSGFIPTNPDQPVNNADRSSTCLDKTLMSAWNSMLKDASANGLNIYIASGYRSYNYQVNVYNRYVKSDGHP